jgi:hypothetical protein
MCPASDRVYRSIEQRVVLPDDPELRAHAHAAVAKHGRRGWRLDKARRADSIDGVVALCVCIEAAENKPAEFELLGYF